MEATNLGCCKLLWRPISKKNLPNRRARKHMVIVRASREDGNRDYVGKTVDEDMIVLRWRIREMKMLETNQEAPSNWMEWEKQYYARYDEDVCEAMGLLQSYLMSVRPSIALGMLAFVALSVLMSSGVGLFHAMAFAKSFLSCFGSS